VASVSFLFYSVFYMRIPRGSQFMMLSAFFVALISLGVKQLSHIPAVEILFFNALGAMVVSFIMLRYHQIPIWGQKRSLLLARGIVGTLGVTLYFFTLQHMALPSAITLHYTAPIFAALIGIFMVQEPVSLKQWLFFALSFSGIVLINGFSMTEASWYVFSGLTGAFFRGLSNSIVRKIEHTEHPLVVTFYSYLATVPLTGTYLLYDFVKLQMQDWMILGAISALGYVAHYYAVKAYQLGPVAPVAATAYVAVIYAILFSYLFLDEKIPAPTLLGVSFILLGVLLTIFSRKKQTA
jgi:drug/metabolite transporter (DMT)-like permease